NAVAEHPLGGRDAEVDIGLAEARLRLDRTVRMCEPILGNITERPGDAEGITHFAVEPPLLAGFQTSGHRLAALLNEADEIPGQFLDVDRVGRGIPLRHLLSRCG